MTALPDPSDPSAALPQARWPWQRSLYTRVLANYGAVVVLVLLVISGLVSRSVYRAQIEEAEHSLAVEALLAANALEDPQSGFVTSFIAREAWQKAMEEKGKEEHEEEEEEHEEKEDEDKNKTETTAANTPQAETLPPLDVSRLVQLATRQALNTGARVAILDAHGNVIADSHVSFGPLPNQISQPEVQAGLRGVPRAAYRRDPRTGERVMALATPIRQGDALLGLVQISKPMAAVVEPFRNFLVRLLWINAAVLGVATVISLALSRQLLRPVRRLEQAALQVAGGNLDQQVPVETADELGALALAFNRMVRQVRQTMARQRAFVANASHELRTPLTNIKLRTEALLGGAYDDPAVAHRYLAEIDRETDRLSRLASALLDLSSLDEGRDVAPALEPQDVVPVVRSAAESVRLRTAQKGIALEVSLPPTLPPLRVRPEHVEMVLMNLLDNALKFTPAGGRVSLSVAAVGDRCIFRVADTGPGIPPKDLPHIFERFYRVDKARSRRAGQAEGTGSGAGLGLAIVKAIVEQTGGTVAVQSTLGQGTVFTVEWTVAQPA